MQNEPEFTNRLIDEKSIYLQQHAHDPVDWYPCGDLDKKDADAWEHRPAEWYKARMDLAKMILD